MDTQQVLNELYEEYWANINELRDRTPELSAPILIKLPRSYSAQNVKLMIIGQQTQGWGDGSVSDLLRCYEEFNFGESYYASPFWNITRKIENALDIDKHAIAWSNLNRCDYNDMRPPSNIERDLFDFIPMLQGEIEIIEPDVVVFFSGPEYDEHIKRAFIGCRFESVEGFSQRELSRINHKMLPQHAYRTYHPKYLRMSGIEPRFVEYIEHINA